MVFYLNDIMIHFVLCPHCALISGNDQCNCGLLQIGTLLNLVQEFGNRQPLICVASGQRCPSALCLFVCSQTDACVAAALYMFQQIQTEGAVELNLCEFSEFLIRGLVGCQ